MSRIDRRSLLLGAAAALAAPALPRRTWAAASAASIASILDASGLGAVSGFAVADLDAGELIEGHDADVGRPPASVAKVVTTLYALDALGPGYRFRTRLLAAGPIEGGTLRGDLVLEGGGDPVLDTDRLGRLVAALKARGIERVEGRLLVADGALPFVPDVARDQPEDAGYNPTLSGMNLNFNRVQMSWAPEQDAGVRRPGREAGGAGRRHRRRGRQGADPSPLRGRARGLVAAGRPGEGARQRLAAGAGAGPLRRRGLRRARGAGRADPAGGRGGGRAPTAPRSRSATARRSTGCCATCCATRPT